MFGEPRDWWWYEVEFLGSCNSGLSKFPLILTILISTNLIFLQSMSFVVLLLSCFWFFETPWTAACQASLSFTITQRLLKLISIQSVMPSNDLILCRPLPLLPSIFPSIRVISNEPVLHIRWPNYWSFNISLSNKYSGLISFRIDWLDLLAVQRTLKSLLQHHSSKASILWCSAFLTVQLTICDYWKKHSFDYTDLCWQNDVSTF